MPRRKKTDGLHIPRRVTRSLLKHGAQGAKRVVVVYQAGIPSRVFGYEEHQKMVDLPGQVKPWEHRKGSGEPPDPLGAVDGGILGPLTRENFYE